MSTIAIETKYHGPTDCVGARISAVCGNCEGPTHGRVYVPYEHALDTEDAHRLAAIHHLKRHHRHDTGDGRKLRHTVKNGHGTREGFAFPLVPIDEVES